MPTVLVVEDDRAVRQGISDALSFSGHEVLSAADGKDGMRQALQATYHLLLLDLVLPFHTGFEILAALRKERPGQPVIILSARGEEADRVKGLRMGADDYVVKPFSLQELLARVDAVLRRTAERPAASGSWSFSHGVVDFDSREIRFHSGTCEELSEREADLLRFLASQGERAVSREEILRHVWKLDPRQVETRTIDMHVAHLRGKLGDNQQTLLQTIRGKGYKLCHDPHR
jgi:DNA-binding response OmpR family regulator